ncbi:hypothetical protein EON65_42090 [archaeon]|nr:MAG: hypothetical protein EON65_42090 [archaeon]
MHAFSLVIVFFFAWRNRQSVFMSPCLANLTPNSLTSEINEQQLSREGLPLLPAVAENKEGYRTLSLGETLPMDELGPIIINPDGTTRRITNWDNLSKQEQLNTWRVISKRNKKRVEALRRHQSESSTTTEPAAEVVEDENEHSDSATE